MDTFLEDKIMDEKLFLYVDKFKDYLKTTGKKSLSEEQENILLDHLRKEIKRYNPNNSPYALEAILTVETTAKGCILHPDMNEESAKNISMAKLILTGKLKHSKEVKERNRKFLS